MFRHPALTLTILLVLTALLIGCAPPATPVQTPAVAAAPNKLILATTTSTADSGLLNVILPAFEREFNADVRVVAVGTGQALEIGSRGDADVVLVHSRAAEDQFVADGNAQERFDVMYNDFIVVGPSEDPAGIAGMALAKDAFQAIADSSQPFASRGDNSGTHGKERAIWASVPFTPTAQLAWFNSMGQGMGETLIVANELHAYALTDRGTFLSMRNRLPDLTILVGGGSLAENEDLSLLNPYGVMAVNPEKQPNVNAALAARFVEWLTSVEVQRMIGEYGVETFGQPLFYPNSAQWQASQ